MSIEVMGLLTPFFISRETVQWAWVPSAPVCGLALVVPGQLSRADRQRRSPVTKENDKEI